MTIIRDWTPDKSHAFGKEVLTFNHDLHTRPMFDDDGLADLLDRYPRLKFVSVESGMGWIPFLLELATYQVGQNGVTHLGLTPPKIIPPAGGDLFE